MSRKNYRQPIERGAEVPEEISLPIEAMQEEAIAPKAPRDVPAHRRCPICWGGRGGTGVAQNTHNKGDKRPAQIKTRYYKCKSCGHDWALPFTVVLTYTDNDPDGVELPRD